MGLKFTERRQAKFAQVHFRTAKVTNRYLVNASLLQSCGQTQQVLPPVQITVEEDIFRMLASKFVEVGQVVWVCADGGDKLPSQESKDYDRSGIFWFCALPKPAGADSCDDG